MKPFTNILVPHDFSQDAKHAVEVAIDLARRYDAKLSILHVQQPLPYAMPDTFPQIQHAALVKAAQQHLEEAKQEAITLGARELTAELLQGQPVQEITRYAASHHHDLIVMGTQGRTGLARIMMGSVAERVVRTAPCAVLTVRAAEAK